MFKNISLALVGLATVSAQSAHHEIDLFNPMNFVNVNTPVILFNNMVNQIQGKNLKDTGDVTWTLCDGADKAVFDIKLD